MRLLLSNRHHENLRTDGDEHSIGLISDTSHHPYHSLAFMWNQNAILVRFLDGRLHVTSLSQNRCPDIALRSSDLCT